MSQRPRSHFSSLLDGAPEDPTECLAHITAKLTIKTVKRTDPSAPKAYNSVRVVCVSDTFGAHSLLTSKMPEGDILVHTGNFTESSQPAEVASFNSWLSTLSYRHKIVVAGNRDVILDAESYAYNWRRAGHHKRYSTEDAKSFLTACTYLDHSSVEIDGVKIFGSAYNSKCFDWAFNAHRGSRGMKRLWDAIPKHTDLLVTHTPPLGHGDTCVDGAHEGCADLLDWVECYRPRLHVFGSVREAAGVSTNGTTTFVNGCSLGLNYLPTEMRSPIVVDMLL